MIRPRPAFPRNGRRFVPSLAAAGAVVASAALAACAGPDVTRAPMDRADVARSLMAAAENGLLVRKWHVEGRPDRIAAALMKHENDDAGAGDIDAETRALLARNGFRLVRVPLERLESLRADLGGTSLDVEGRHGQSYDWRDIASWPVGPAPLAVALDGRVRRFSGGHLKLMMRGWTIPMEDGPGLQVHLRPEHDRTRPSRLDQMLGKAEFEGERFDALAVELLLEAGSAYVLTSESPSVEWRPDAGADARREPDAPAAGPVAAAPLTIGERLFAVPEDAAANAAFAGRDSPRPPQALLLLIPKIPAALFPPELQTASRTDTRPRSGS